MSVTPVWNSRNRNAWMSAGSMHVCILLCSEETETETETVCTETSDRDPCNGGAVQGHFNHAVTLIKIEIRS
jgi:hypothetical protein